MPFKGVCSGTSFCRLVSVYWLRELDFIDETQTSKDNIKAEEPTRVFD